MAKVRAYHTNEVEYPPEHRNVHHNHDDCVYGNRIKREHRLEGDGRKPLCTECARLG